MSSQASGGVAIQREELTGHDLENSDQLFEVGAVMYGRREYQFHTTYKR